MKRFILVFVAFLFIGSGVAMAADGDTSIGDFLSGIVNFAKEFKNMALGMKVAGILTIILSTIKVSALREMLWDKWGSAKVLVAPILALIIGVLSLEHVTAKSVLEYVAAVGGGAIVLHQLLDALKSKLLKYPWALAIIGFIQGVLPTAVLAPEIAEKK